MVTKTKNDIKKNVTVCKIMEKNIRKEYIEKHNKKILFQR